MANNKVVCMVFLCIVLLRASREGDAAITCGGVVKTLAPCMTYLRSSGGLNFPPANCCTGVKALKGMANNPADRKAACLCMKATAAKTKGLNYGNAARLPGQCGVSIRYSFSPNTNCNSVQ